MIRADAILPGDKVDPVGWTVHAVSQRLATEPRMRVVIITWCEGLEENWAPSMLPPMELHPVIRAGELAVGECRARFGASDTERCTKPTGHEITAHGNGRYIWGPALVVPEVEFRRV